MRRSREKKGARSGVGVGRNRQEEREEEGGGGLMRHPGIGRMR